MRDMLLNYLIFCIAIVTKILFFSRCLYIHRFTYGKASDSGLPSLLFFLVIKLVFIHHDSFNPI